MQIKKNIKNTKIDCDKELKNEILKIGARISKKKNWDFLTDQQAIYLYLIEKYHWLPREIYKLKDEELYYLLIEFF